MNDDIISINFMTYMTIDGVDDWYEWKQVYEICNVKGF